MAFFYYTYDTTIGNTIISGATGSSAPLPSGLSEIYIDFEPLYQQPVYLYRISGGTPIPNTQQYVDEYMAKYLPPEADDFITQIEYSGNTAVIETRLFGIEDYVGYNPTGTTNVVIVDFGGTGDFVGVKEAVDSITGATALEPWVIKVNAGSYNEDPIIIPEYVTIEGIGSTIYPNDESNPLLSGTNNFKIKTIGLDAPNNSYAVDVRGNYNNINAIDVTGTGKGVYVSGSTTGTTINGSFFRTGLANGITADNAMFSVGNLDINATTGILATNSSIINVVNHIGSGTYGFDITNNSRIDFNNVRFPSATIGVRLTNTSVLNGITLIMDSVSGWAIQQASADSTVIVTDAVFDPNKVQAVNPANVSISYRDVGIRVTNAYSGFTGTTNTYFDYIASGITKMENEVATYLGIPQPNPYSRSDVQDTTLGDAIITGFTNLENEKIDKVTGATDYIAIFKEDGNVEYVDGLNLSFLTGGTDTYYYLDQTLRVTTTNTVTTPAIYISGGTLLGAGRYSLDFNAIGGNSSPNKYLGIQFQIDDTTVGHETKFKTNAGDVDYSGNVTKDVDLLAGTHTFRIIFYQQAGGTAYLEYGAIRVRKQN